MLKRAIDHFNISKTLSRILAQHKTFWRQFSPDASGPKWIKPRWDAIIMAHNLRRDKT